MPEPIEAKTDHQEHELLASSPPTGHSMQVIGGPAVGEKDMLRGFLDRRRSALVTIVRELGGERAVAVRMPSGTTVLGIVSHLAWMERWWFEATFMGEDVVFPWTDSDPDADWQPGAAEDVVAVLERYRAAARRSDAIIRDASLDDLARRPHMPAFQIGEQNLRWIVIHMVEETAQHLGHAEILQELATQA